MSLLSSNNAGLIFLDDQSIKEVASKIESRKYVEKDIKRFNISKAESASFMFEDCSSLKELDLSKWNTSKVKNMSYMFNRCKSLKTIIMKNCNDKTIDMIKKRLEKDNIKAEIVR